MMTSPIKTAALGLAQKRALLAARLRQVASQPRQSPLSFAQQRLWFLDQLEPNSPLYNIGSLARIKGHLDLNALRTALDAVVARHETLRTRFACPDEMPVQIIDPHGSFRLEVVDLSNERTVEREAQARRLVMAELNRPFDLASQHPLRVTLVQVQPEEYQLILILHHIAGDEWSLRILFQELTVLYSSLVTGKSLALPPLAIQYADYASWQKQWLQGDVLRTQLDYWKKQLNGHPPVTELRTDHPRGTVQTFNGRTMTRPLGKTLTDGLEELARQHEATPFMVALAAFKVLIHRYTQQEDLIVCSPVAGRNRVETEGLIGFFANTVALRTNLAGDPGFDQLLARVREVTLNAMAHQDLPFDRVVEELQPERTLTHLPFTKLMFSFQAGTPESLGLPGAILEFLEVEPELAKFEITLGLRQTRAGLHAIMEYNRDLFEPDTIVRLLDHYQTLLQSIVSEPHRRISELQMVTAPEREQLLVQWNQTSSDYPRECCIHELFEKQVERAPDATAISWGQRKMSYGELNSRANQLARFLKQFNLRPDAPIGLCVERSLEMVVGMLGCLKVGGAYVPLDANYPKERLAFMLEDAGARVVITQQKLLERLPRNGAKVVCLDADWEFIAREQRGNLSGAVKARNLAYIMYTSGSTGQPKGVAVPHRGVIRLVLNTDFVQLDASDRMAQVSNISFDAATFELWGALLNGAQLIGITRDVALSPRDFAAELREQGITVMFLTAALFNQLAAEAPGAFESLRTVIAGGEALDPKWVRAVLQNRPPRRLVNGYGPTENTTFTCCHTILQLADEALNVPIGRPIRNTTVFILDRHLSPVPIGVPGELYTGGDGLASGYWNRPELTDEKFVQNPFDSKGSSRLYRTGDLARYLPDGSVEFLGRIDDQVKIRGFRIELGEIETSLGRHPDVRECVLAVAGSDSAEKRLVAYVVAAPDHSPNASELRAYLKQQLPDYMIPSVFVKLAALPLTPNGKVDRKALPAPDQARPRLDRQYVAPRDATESKLVAIWEAILEVRPIGIQDKFFDLGGHSMLAVRVIAQIEKAFGKRLRLATLFQAPTIERLAAVLREEIKECTVSAGTSLVEIQGAGRRPPLFLVHGAGGGMFWGYVNLARALGTEQPVYGFKSRGLDGQREFASVEELAAHYVADLRKVQPLGPYYLGGYCFGGNVAYEMACQLSEQGQQVALLALLNCAPPNSRYTQIPWTPRWAMRFGRNLLYWANYFSHWSPTQRREFFRWKWQLLKKKFTRAWHSSARHLSKVEPGDLVDLSSYTEDQKLIWETHIRALVNFHPRAYCDRIHLFRSPGHPLWCSFDDQYGWGDLAKGGVQLVTIAGAHEKILEEPWVKALATELARALESTHSLPAALLPLTPDNSTKRSVADDRAAWSTKSAEAPPSVTYPDLLLSRADPQRFHVAIRCGSTELTYEHLERRANQLAHYLHQLGVGPDALVGVSLERSIDLGVALLGIMKAGGAYLPLDPEYPAERIAFMVEDAAPRVLLTHRQLVGKMPIASPRMICLDDPEVRAAIEGCNEQPPSAGTSADHLAYVIYTSGSTGVPKAVEITHSSLINHNLAVLEAYHLQNTDRVLQFTALSFDISVEEIFPTWLAGGALILRSDEVISSPDRFLKFLASERITVLNLPTAYWHELVSFLHASQNRLPKSVRLVIIGGEKASDEAYRKWKECVQGSVRLINGYGATEATITSTLYEARPDEDTLPIGRPIANTQTIILDDQLRPVSPGTPGQLYIGGAGLARGYLKRPQLTAQAFINNPVPSLVPSARLYRTGDLVRERSDGNLEFIGRLDDQVKIRGYRIELGEIAAALEKHPEVKEAAVVARELASGGRRVIAYFVPRTAPGPRISNILNLLKRTLPHYMIPSALVPLEKMPLTPAGKIDRAALPAPGTARPNLEQKFVAAANPTENRVAKLWAEVLDLQHVGMNDNFLELGGDSLLATRVLSRIREEFGTELSLAAFFLRPTISSLAQHVDELVLRASAANVASSSAGVEKLPLSPGQERIWFLDQLDPKRTAYNRAVSVRLSGPLDASALERALTDLVQRHDSLRAVFPPEDGRPVQILVPPDEIKLAMTDLSGIPEDTRLEQAMKFASRAAFQPHILAQPVLKPLLLKLGGADYLLVLALNEIGVDNQSVQILLRELPVLYSAAVQRTSASLPRISSRATALVAPVASTSQADQETQLNFWKSQLAGLPDLLDLPADRPRPAQGDYKGARLSFELPTQVTQGTFKLVADSQTDSFAVILSAFAAVLHRYTGAQQVLIGSSVSNRSPDLAEAVGAFENRIALRCDFSGDPTFAELVNRSANTIHTARAHGSLPFATVVSALCPRKSPSYTPIFQVAFYLQTDAFPEFNAAGVRFTPCEVDTQTSKFDLSLKLLESEDGFRGWIEYSTSLFEPSRIGRLVQHFQTLLGNAAEQPSRHISELELLSKSEARQVLVDWNATDLDYPKTKTLVDLFREQCLRTPEAEALIAGQQRLTFGDLYARASALAARLQEIGITTEALVGICLERSAEMVIALLGTLMAGGAYVPLDPKYPKDRLSFSLQDAQAKVLLTQRSLLPLLPQTDAQVLCMDVAEDVRTNGDQKLVEHVSKPSDLAYVIYTSGSTGKPKGVALEHRNAVSFVAWAQQTFTAEELSGVLASTSICFDLSVFELFVPLCCGGKVFLAENALALTTLPAACEVRLINTVPSAIRELLRMRGVPQGVRVINLAGEPLAAELVDQIYRETSVTRVFDLYGPTETTTYSTGAVRQAGRSATIGRPLANEQVYLLDPNLQPVPIGVPGELLIGGAGVSRGYLNRPELTAQKFIANPFIEGGRLYRTGDLARWREDGNLEYLGRIDHQVKIRGFRIELGEVEAALKACADVSAAVAMAREDAPGDKRLVAYVVLRPGCSVAIDQLKQQLLKKLPDFMVPSAFVFIPELPLTPNGKIDRKALPPPGDPSEAARADLVDPRNDTEKQLATLWRDVLRVNQISVHDNFFDLGGHSLLAARIISGIRESLKVELPLSSLFSAPTIAALAEVISNASTQNVRVIAPAINAISRTQKLPVSYVQERLWFLDQLNPGSAAYNVPTALRLKGPLDLEALAKALNLLVSRHEVLRTIFRYADNQLTQEIADHLIVPIPFHDLAAELVEEREARARELVNEEARRPFDLAAGPLLRANVFRLNEADHLFLVVMHHSISDGWSLALFFQELAALYQAESSPQRTAKLVPLSVQYADFSYWQRQWMTGQVLENELAFWKRCLADAPAEIRLPSDRPRPERPTGRADSIVTILDGGATRRVTEFARRQGCTPFMFFLTALFIALRKWTGQMDLVVGTVVAGRTHRELENILGCFMNFLPVRAIVNDEEPAGKLLDRVRAAVLDCQSHQNCPFEKIVEAINPRRRRDQNPLYNVGLLLQNFPPNLFQTESLQASSCPVSLETALLDLRFEIEQANQGLALTCEFKTDLFDRSTVERFLSSWQQAINGLLSSSESPVKAIAPVQPSQEPQEATANGTDQSAIQIAATFTAEPIAEPVRFWLQRLELPAQVEFAPYNQVFQQLLDPASQLSRNKRGLNILLIRLQDWQSEDPCSREEEREGSGQSNLERSVGDLLRAVKANVARSSVPLLIAFCPPGPPAASRNSELEAVRMRLEEELAQITGVFLLTTEELAKWYPVKDFYDAAADELGQVPYTPLFFTALGTALTRKFHALNRPAFKVIALDCDNTLWSGVCGEVGPQGIELNAHFQALQQFMETQRQNGMLLCLCSKNNQEDVGAVFAERADFPLQLGHFTAVRLNWETKSSNLKSLAKELSLGLDSFIFLDDNPVECAEVRANCPEVLVLQLPENSAKIGQFLNHCWVFDRLKLTAEDRVRGELYEQNRRRETLRAQAPTLEQFLESLELKIELQPLQSSDYVRAAQLTQRTNQFNLTTRRRTESELSQWLSAGEGIVVRVSDRFGDYGLVGVLLYQVAGQSVVVDTFLLSCRVLGRGVEHRMLASLAQSVRRQNVDWLDLHFVPTPKNKPALDFLEHVAGSFKQPLNGGFVFRLPVDFAAQVNFQSDSAISHNGAGDHAAVDLSSRPGMVSTAARFPGCQEVALEANDPARIHERMRAAVSVRQRGQGDYAAPQSELEHKLCRLWQDLLHVEPVGVNDDFFELGGHSLLAVRLFAEIEKIVGHKFPLVTLFQAPTISQLARVLSQDKGEGSLLVPIQPKGDLSPLFLVHGAGGDVLWGYANLAAHLPPDRPIYGIKSHTRESGLENLGLEQMARAYLEVIRARQPKGPYYLGGYCFGGNVAYEMARQLRMQGQEVALVLLIDTAPANAGYETLTWYRPGFAWRFSRNLRFWLADFMALSSQERRNFVGRKLRWLGRKLQRRLGLTPGPARFDLEEVIETSHFPQHELKLWQSHLEALIAHVERPYDGKVVLLRTRGQPLFCSLEDDFCWGKLVKPGVTVRCIPGSHENIFMEPHVRVLASEISGLLDTRSARPVNGNRTKALLPANEPVLRV